MSKAERKRNHIVSTGPHSDSEKNLTPKDQIKNRCTRELVIGFCGALGSGVSTVARKLSEILEEHNYTITHVKISKLLENISETPGIKEVLEEKLSSYSQIVEKEQAKRFVKLQEVGNYLREKNGEDILAQWAISYIFLERIKPYDTDIKSKQIEDILEDILGDENHRFAYIIESLKHPAEVQLFRTLYGDMFYLIGVLCSRDVRRSRLIKYKGITDSEASYLINRDESENIAYGQQLVKTLQFADFFVRNNCDNTDILNDALERYIKLILGKPAITPTKHEYAMYVAQSAALRSACLSRQVGAAILNSEGEVIATGCNDVPKKGGLYTIEDEEKDYRCKNIRDGECFNDRYKTLIKKDIKKILKNKVNESDELDTLVNKISSETRLRDLLEFSRSIHAEMDAIISVARNGSASLKGASLYTTLFPCHICARHIIASGIKEVYYIEPYEKSLALDLHFDSICLEPSESNQSTDRVIFQHFEGVAPRQYLNLFRAADDRKDDTGKLKKTNLCKTNPVISKYLDPYIKYEQKVIQNFSQTDVYKKTAELKDIEKFTHTNSQSKKPE